MPLRRKLAHRSEKVSWSLAYALYLLTSIGLIIASEITVKYGSRFFGDVNAPIPPIDPEVTPEEASIGQAHLRAQRDHALARSGVVGSVGIAVGSVALILIIATFVAHSILDYRGLKRDPTSEYRNRETLTVVSCAINFILFGGNFALCAGFALTADAIRRYTTADESTAPGYLVGCAVMAALSGAAAGSTIVMDVLRYRALSKIIRDGEREYGVSGQGQAVELNRVRQD